MIFHRKSATGEAGAASNALVIQDVPVIVALLGPTPDTRHALHTAFLAPRTLPPPSDLNGDG